MNEVATAHFEKARQALRAAHLLLEESEADACINRAYYAVFHAAHAALAQVGESPKTHQGTQARFWTRFVKTGRFPKPVGQVFSHAQDQRRQADYEAFSRFDTMAAADLLRDVTSFVDAAEALVQELAEGSEEHPS